MARELPFHVIRAAARLSNGFMLSSVKLSGFGRDVIDGLLLVAVTQANVAPITRDAELQRAYARLDAPPPDALRRPVSVNAIASSLHIPFETARRRLAGLAESGVVLATPKGLIVPQAPLISPFYRLAAEGHYRLVQRLYERLRAVGMLDDLPAPATDAVWALEEPPPIRLVVRLSSDYILRLAEPLHEVGDILSSLLLLDIIAANTEHLPDGFAGENDPTPAGFVADADRRPVRPSELSERLGAPSETVRRHVHRLQKDGFIQSTGEGVIAPAAVLARPLFIRYMRDNQIHLSRLFNGLAESGVLGLWDAERQQAEQMDRPPQALATPQFG